MKKGKGMFGENSRVTALINRDEDFNIEESLKAAVLNLKADINIYKPTAIDNTNIDNVNKDIPADPNVRNFTFTIINGNIYYREMQICITLILVSRQRKGNRASQNKTDNS